MELFNLLTKVNIFVYGQTFDVSLNWIGSLIRWLISGIGIVGVGIIVFSLILKVIVLPFDIYQRISMRKQNIKMKENQARMEKLQKQYANDKETYNRKVMEMYRESGLSMMSSCLPMIFSMIIFIVAINGFNAYSQYSNVENYNAMVSAYNKQIVTMATELESQGKDVEFDETTKQYTFTLEQLETDAEIKAAMDAELAAAKQAGISMTKTQAVQNYFSKKAQEAVVQEYETNVKNKTAFLWIKNIWATDASYKHPILDYTSFQQEISREKFIVNGEKKSLTGAITATTNSPYEELAYNQITGKLTEQKSQANGYYILIVLSIGTILLQQFISMRSQKEQQKYSSVDGQGASQQKTMMFVMTAMFAVFAFMYSSAFSIYMIVSNITSLISTIVINKFVDKAWEKKEAKALQEKYNKRLGRVNVADKNKKK